MPADDTHRADPPAPEPGGDRGSLEERVEHARLGIEERVDHARQEIEERFDAARVQFEETNERIRKRTGRDLIPAILIGILLGGALLTSLLWVKWIFIVFAAVLVGFAVLEFTTALRIAGRRIPRVISVIVAVGVMPVAFFLHVAGLWIAIVAAVLIVAVWRLVSLAVPGQRGSARDIVLDLAAGSLVQIYVPFLAGFYLALTGAPGGEWWTLAAAIIVVAVDTAAYVTGLNFGRHKMAPTISPGKTWEGLLGAAIVALVAGVLLAWLMLDQPWWVGLLLGVAVLGTAVLGDLTESLIKRDLGVKDISSWLPGHGGFLDRLDSILPSGVVAFAFALVFDAGIPG